MTIGELSRRVEVLQFYEDRDEYGGVVGKWITVGKVWAKIEPISGVEYFQSQQINAEMTSKITVRFYAGLTVMHRIKYGEKLYEIIGIGDAETSHRWTVINCKEMVDGELQRKAEESKGRD